MMDKYYFTFGNDDDYPFKSGWVEVTASSAERAIEVFRRKYPDAREGLVNCAGIYNRNSFMNTSMAKDPAAMRVLCRDKLFEVNNLEVETTAGTIVVRRNTEPGAPGVSVNLTQPGQAGEILLAFFEVKEDPDFRTTDEETEKDVTLYIYSNASDECSDKIIFRGEELQAVYE